MLNTMQIEKYKQEGYIVLENLFTKEEVKEATDNIQKMLSGDISKIAELEPKDNTVVRRIWSPTERSEVFYNMAINDKLLNIIAQLIGENITLHYSKLNCKGPKVGSLVDWHQDFSYYPHTNTDLIACLIYLDDADEENGCLTVVPRTEYSGLLNHYIDGYFRGKINATEFVEKKQILLAAPAGSVIFLHCLTAHFSKINTSDRERRTFIPAYRASDAFPIYFGPHAAHNEPKAKVIRGKRLNIARVEPMEVVLPFTEKQFDSLYSLQEGSFTHNEGNRTGYHSHE